jgi:NitT/TauT family transport system permease protein
MNKYFDLRGTLSKRDEWVVQIAFFVFAILVMHFVAVSQIVPRGIIPPPLKILTAFGEMWMEDGLFWHMLKSIFLNVLGYLEAAAICLPLGFILGLFPIFGAMSKRLLSATRGLPLPALTGVFIAAFGIGTAMKVHFLAAGIAVYLLPTVVNRVAETPVVYDQMARTLGASPWQRIRYIFIPDVLSRVFNDIIVLVALSWTYITLSEVINSRQGGLGALIYAASRNSRMDKIYAVVILILFIIWVQDQAMYLWERRAFRFKYKEAKV